MSLKRLDIIQPLFERLKNASESEFKNALLFGLPMGYGGRVSPVAVAVVNYEDENSYKVALRSVPFGLSLIGVCEVAQEDADQRLYAMLDSVSDAVLLKVTDGKISASCGLDYLTSIHLNVVSADEFWSELVCTFRVKGKILLQSLLEKPELENCIARAKNRVANQASYQLSDKPGAYLLPRDGTLVADVGGKTKLETVSELYRNLNKGNKLGNEKYFSPNLSLMEIDILYDHAKVSSRDVAPVILSDASARCKYFEYYVDIDALVIVPMGMPVKRLYRKFNSAVCTQLEYGFHDNIKFQLKYSIHAEKPEVFHFWLPYARHFLSVTYPQNTSEEKLRDTRLLLHKVFYAPETRPYFRRSGALFQSYGGLISPHVGLKGKYPETQIVKGHLEYKHYMQDGFNDDGWGCAYRSLQTIISWFKLQGFTAAKIPTHREIQECLVSLGDKPRDFVGTKRWIGSTEVGFVLEALLGISCRFISVSSGAELTSRASELESHFKIHGTPVMIGGGVLAHTIIGISRDPDEESNVQYLILDPHYTGKDDLNTIQPGKNGWVSWKDNNFWSKTDFYNLCLPLLPSAI